MMIRALKRRSLAALEKDKARRDCTTRSWKQRISISGELPVSLAGRETRKCKSARGESARNRVNSASAAVVWSAGRLATLDTHKTREPTGLANDAQTRRSLLARAT